MKIWLLKAGEILPTEKRDGLLRTGSLAEILVARGHDVTWWSSTFNHFKKTHLYPGPTTVEIAPNYRLKLLHANAYQRNISITRFKNHWLEGRQFREMAANESRPDIIVASLPTLDLAYEATRYGKARGIPVLVDIRDLWPEIFVDVLPKPAQPLGRLAFAPLFMRLNKICRDASALSAVSPEILNYALQKSGRPRNEWDRHFWLGSSVIPATEEAKAAVRKKWQTLTKKENPFLVTFVGAFSGKLELETVVEAARILEKSAPNIHFVLAGNGDTFASIQERAKGLTNLTLPGWLDRHEVFALLGISSAGLAPFRSRMDFMWSLPTKAIEYMAAGLPVVSSLNGSLKAALKKYDCGVTYENGNSQQLAQILMDLEKNPEKRDRLAEDSLAIGTNELSGQVVYSMMADHIEKIAKEFQLPGKAASIFQRLKMNFVKKLDSPDFFMEAASLHDQMLFLNQLLAKQRTPLSYERRSFLQYLCHIKVIGQWQHFKAQLICFVLEIPFLLLVLAKGCGKDHSHANGPNGQQVAVLFHSDPNYVPRSLRNEFAVQLGTNSWAFSIGDLWFFLRYVVLPHPFSFSYHVIILQKLARFRANLSSSVAAYIVSDVYSAASSLMTMWCERNHVEHIIIMHGIQIVSLRHAFSAHHRSYIWDSYFLDVFAVTAQVARRFVVERPPVLDVQLGENRASTTIVQIKYFLQGQKEEELHNIANVLRPLLNECSVTIRPHPLYSKKEGLAQVFRGFKIEENSVPINLSLAEADYVISRYSTILFQAWLFRRQIVIDDMTSPEFFEYLKGSRFIMLAKEHILLSHFLKFERFSIVNSSEVDFTT